MKVGIMQPYFLPYLGYFQLIQHCDVFVIYDDIQYSKRGWINRNRMLYSGIPKIFTIPLEKGSDFLDIRDRSVSSTFDAKKLQDTFNQAYNKAPQREICLGLISDILEYSDRNLFEFINHSIKQIAALLSIDTEIVVSSHLGNFQELRGQKRVLRTCEELGATQYINPIGGSKLYQQNSFHEMGISLSFLRSKLTEYPQGGGDFVGGLSIVDVLAWNGLDACLLALENDYEVLAPSEVSALERAVEGHGYVGHIAEDSE